MFSRNFCEVYYLRNSIHNHFHRNNKRDSFCCISERLPPLFHQCKQNFPYLRTVSLRSENYVVVSQGPCRLVVLEVRGPLQACWPLCPQSSDFPSQSSFHISYNDNDRSASSTIPSSNNNDAAFEILVRLGHAIASQGVCAWNSTRWIGRRTFARGNSRSSQCLHAAWATTTTTTATIILFQAVVVYMISKPLTDGFTLSPCPCCDNAHYFLFGFGASTSLSSICALAWSFQVGHSGGLFDSRPLSSQAHKSSFSLDLSLALLWVARSLRGYNDFSRYSL